MSSLDGRGGRGRPFAPGNPGRKPGSKNKRTLIATELLDSAGPELLQKAIARAKRGNVALQKYLLDRWLPRERLTKIDLPEMNSADDAVRVIGHIIHSVCEGRITSREGTNLVHIVDSYAHATEIADMVKRMEVLEAQIKGSA